MKWRETGDVTALSADLTPAAVADPAPATPVKAASTDASPEAAPETADSIYKAKTETRFQELLASNAELKKQLAALTPPAPAAPVSDVKPAVSSPALAAVAADDPEPNPEDAAKYPNGEFDRKYVRDTAAWEARAVLRAERAAYAAEVTQRQQQAHAKQLEDTWGARMTATKSKHADFDELALDKLIPAGSPMDRWALENEGIEEALYFLSTHPAEVARIVAMPVTQQMRALFSLEETTKIPAAKIVSDAPEPQATLGRRPAVAGDPIDRALRAKDVGAYIAAANARDAALVKH